jgi:hypothetical protein
LPPLSRVFTPARLTDTPQLTGNDPAYAQMLMDLDPCGAQLLERNRLAGTSQS